MFPLLRLLNLPQLQLLSLNLPRDSLRQTLHELNRPRILIRSRHLLDILLDVADKGFRWRESVRKHNKCLDNLAPDDIRRPDDRCLLHGGVLHKCTLHLERADTVPGRFYHIIIPPDKPEIPVLIPVCLIAGIVITFRERFGIILGIVNIFPKEANRPWIQFNRNMPFFHRGSHLSLIG